MSIDRHFLHIPREFAAKIVYHRSSVQHLDCHSRIGNFKSPDEDSRLKDWNTSEIIPLIQVLRKMRAHYAGTGGFRLRVAAHRLSYFS
jgi:hypothetical protein